MTETYCVAADVKLKAGTNSATLTDGQYTTLINQAESWINHVMQKDFISTYSGLDEGVKLILNDITSSKAAYMAIAFNQDGYFLGEVTNLLNVNNQIVRDGIDQLKDKDTVAAIEEGY